MTNRTVLRVSAGVELGTLVVLLANLITVHLPEVSQAIGPIHGLAYIGSVVCALLLARGNHRVWLLSLIPGVGGILAARAARAAEVKSDRSA
jgi:hypothetical protein